MSSEKLTLEGLPQWGERTGRGLKMFRWCAACVHGGAVVEIVRSGHFYTGDGSRERGTLRVFVASSWCGARPSSSYSEATSRLLLACAAPAPLRHGPMAAASLLNVYDYKTNYVIRDS